MMEAAIADNIALPSLPDERPAGFASLRAPADWASGSPDRPQACR